MTARTLILGSALLGALSMPSCPAQKPSVRLEGVPESLTLPLRPGKNVVLTARVSGGRAKRAWIAVGPDAPGRFMLTRVGENEFQANLGDRIAAVLLTATPWETRFQVFVELEGGRIVASIPVSYAVDWAIPSGGLEAKVIYKDGAVEVLPIPREEAEKEGEVSFWGDFGGGEVGAKWKEKKKGKWLDLDALDRIEIPVDRHPEILGLSARVGTKVFPFSSSKGNLGAVLPLTPELRGAWEKEGTLRVQVGTRSGEKRVLELKARPFKLLFDGNLAEVTIYQRTKAALSGSHDYLVLEIGDVTAGQVLVRLVDAEGKVRVPRKSMREGDSVRFRLGAKDYTLYLKNLVNFLIGELIRVTGLSGTDRFLGMVFGAARGGLLVVVLAGLLSLAPVQQDAWWRESALLPHFLLIADWSKNLILGFSGQWVAGSLNPAG